jgi:ribonuclease VapC
MIIDTSAMVAILSGEADASRFAMAIEAAPTPRIGTPALLEATIVLTRWYGDGALEALDAFVREAGAEVVAFDLPQLRAAQAAYLRFGKGRHPAGLNFGDCMSYALALASGEPLLYKGNDFSQTDVEAALAQ